MHKIGIFNDPAINATLAKGEGNPNHDDKGRFASGDGAGGAADAKSGNKEKATTYWHGDKAEYTGATKEMHGATFHEVKLTEGHLKGESKWTQQAPNAPDYRDKAQERKPVTPQVPVKR